MRASLLTETWLSSLLPGKTVVTAVRWCTRPDLPWAKVSKEGRTPPIEQLAFGDMATVEDCAMGALPHTTDADGTVMHVVILPFTLVHSNS